MRWIDKKDAFCSSRGHSLVNSFLERQWDEVDGCYVNCDFDTFKRNEAFKELLLEEQAWYCCYCMRDMSGQVGGQDNECRCGVTLEHVIPHKSRVDEDFYKKHCDCLNDVVFYDINENDKKQKHLSTPPYPHFCAYENIVASCDGSIYQTEKPETENIYRLHETCNNKRGTKRIIPLFFNRDIETTLIYLGDGTVSYSDDVSDDDALIWDETLEAVRLENKRLKMFRRAWAQISSSEYTDGQVYDARNNKVLRENIIKDIDMDTNDQLCLKKDLYWDLLCQYHWFYGYFKRMAAKKRSEG